MKNLISCGDTMVVKATATAYASGDVVVVNDTVGVAVASAAVGDDLVLQLEGRFNLPKAVGAINQGVKVYWDATNKVVTTTASGNTLMGRAVTAQLSADTTVDVLITPTN